MKIEKIITSIALLLGIYHAPVMGQVTNDLDQATNEEIAECARMEVGLFTDKLSSIVVPKQSPKNRRLLKEGALNLFIGKGEEYQTFVYDSLNECVIDTIYNEAVKMQTTTLRDTTIRKNTPMARYLDTLVYKANVREYIKITIRTTDWRDMRVSQIRKLADGKYVIDVYFDQWYKTELVGETKTRLLYRDKTTKKVVCYIDISEILTGKKIIIRLGDIFAEETTSYRS